METLTEMIEQFDDAQLTEHIAAGLKNEASDMLKPLMELAKGEVGARELACSVVLGVVISLGSIAVAPQAARLSDPGLLFGRIRPIFNLPGPGKRATALVEFLSDLVVAPRIFQQWKVTKHCWRHYTLTVSARSAWEAEKLAEQEDDEQWQPEWGYEMSDEEEELGDRFNVEPLDAERTTP